MSSLRKILFWVSMVLAVVMGLFHFFITPVYIIWPTIAFMGTMWAVVGGRMATKEDSFMLFAIAALGLFVIALW